MTGIVPPSGIRPLDGFPGVSSMYVSPSSVFRRSTARVLRGSGAYCWDSSITACVNPSDPSEIAFTLPTLTPEIRTSASWAS